MKHQHYTLGLGQLKSGYRLFVGWCPVWEFWGHYINPLTYWRFVKWFCQRGWRGYAACDHWDADSYFEFIMLGVLSDLKKKTHGCPASLSDCDPLDESDYEKEDLGFERWGKILGEIIEGLEASIELKYEDTVPEGVYSNEPIAWKRVKEESDELWTMVETDTPRFNEELYERWAQPLRAKRKRAMLLICKYWGNLWD